MYKAGKFWVTAGITTFSILGIANTTNMAHAQDVKSSHSEVVTQYSQSRQKLNNIKSQTLTVKNTTSSSSVSDSSARTSQSSISSSRKATVTSSSYNTNNSTYTSQVTTSRATSNVSSAQHNQRNTSANTSMKVNADVRSSTVTDHKAVLNTIQSAPASSSNNVNNPSNTPSPVITPSAGKHDTTSVNVNNEELQNAVNSAKAAGVKVTQEPTREGTVTPAQVNEAQQKVQEDYQNQIQNLQNAETQQEKNNAVHEASVKAHEAAIAQNKQIAAENEANKAKVDQANQAAEEKYQQEETAYKQAYQEYEDKLKQMQNAGSVINGQNRADFKGTLELGHESNAKAEVTYINPALQRTGSHSDSDWLTYKKDKDSKSINIPARGSQNNIDNTNKNISNYDSWLGPNCQSYSTSSQNGISGKALQVTYTGLQDSTYNGDNQSCVHL